MRTVTVLGAIAALAMGLSGCAVVGAGASVGATVVGTAADLAGDVITAPFGGSNSDKTKKD